jgi:hypothetical protein
MMAGVERLSLGELVSALADQDAARRPTGATMR